MSKRLAFLAATSALAFALPAAAQVDDRYAGVEEVVETYSEPVVQDVPQWQDGPEATGASYAHGDYAEPDGYVEEVVERRSRGGHHGGHQAAPAGPPQLAYTAAERDEWLAQCRALHAPQQPVYYDERERDRDGGIIGGVVGAVAGGVIGHEVRNRNRLLSTVLGAGIGGVAGAVLGTVIDRATSRDDDRHMVEAPQDPGFDYCAAYLQNYERGYGTQGQMAYAQVMLVPVAQQPMMQSQHHERRVIIEEEEVEVEAPRRHRATRVIHRQPAGDKRTRIN